MCFYDKIPTQNLSHKLNEQCASQVCYENEEEVLSNHVYFYDRVKDEILDLGEADE